MTRRVVITGMGTVNSLSLDVSAFWDALCAGRSGVGTIEQFDTIDDGQQGQIRVKLKYSITGEKVIHELDRQSKPGRRIYRSVDDLPKVLNGMGIAVVSTSKGVMSDRRAREQNVGGELLCTVS